MDGSAQTGPQDCLSVAEAAWRAARRPGAALPRRSDLSPGALDVALPVSALIDVTGIGHARLRAVGRTLCDVFGMELSGMALTALIAPEDRQRVAACLHGAPRRVEITAGATCRRRAQPCPVRLLLLPLDDGQGRVARLLATFDLPPRVLLQPGDLAVTGIDMRALGHDAQPAFAEAQAPYATGPGHRRGLRLVHNRG